MASLSEAEQEEPEAMEIEKGDEEQGTLPKYLKCSYLDAVVGKEIHNYWGYRVLEHTNSHGEVLALKVSNPDGIDRSQADMMHYAATHGVLAPKVRGVYDIITKRPIARVMIGDRIPGAPLVDVWQNMSQAEQTSIKGQLRKQIQQMRTLVQPYIGGIDKQPTRNIYNTTLIRHCGPFEDEESFDEWCLARLSGGSFQHWKWKRVLEKKRRKSTGRFVLTHGDLSPRNIMVDGSNITGIIDWELSGFYPEYVEYAVAIGLGPGIEEWWVPVLKEVLEPCSPDLVKFTELIEERMGSY
ncbi:kinase-like domain-containing protein [Fusarium redolens]|uniref:Kinase-like domain-containing protein n=1 Tax=Fusarium redolens TaxID=48865 RepID=A0A9P9JZL3_FUSRE|nr:kinase-like domain-containing protein [Fusarium redolens]KAH7243597.1 kinase-like domain-containing protein [Fusarium redolens]